MANIDLRKYGITGTTELLYNPSYEVLFEEEMKSDLEGFDKGQLTELDAVNVMTGIYTGRSPKDKFIVMDDISKDTVWWTSDEFKNDNKPASKEAWDECKKLAVEQLSNKKLYVMDVFCGTNKDSRMAIRFIMEVAWQAHFVKNMFIAPSAEELEGDEMLPAAVDIILETGQASVSMLQRRLKLGYARAARIVDEMEEKGIVGPHQGSKPRAILITKEQWEATKSGNEQLAFEDFEAADADGVPEELE